MDISQKPFPRDFAHTVSALHIAAGAQHTDCVSTLLQRGADCRRDQTGTLPQELGRKPDSVELMNRFAIQIT